MWLAVEEVNRGAARRAPIRILVFTCASLVALCAAATAQARASLGVGVGTIRTEQGTPFSAASLSPALRYTEAALLAQASGFVASLPNGVWATHGRLYFWGITPRLTGRWRLGTEEILTGTTETSAAATAAAHGVAELLWARPRWGVGLGAGPSAGFIAHEPSVVALHTRARAWWRPASGTQWQASVEPTRFFGAWFTDVSAGVLVERGPAVVSLEADARLSHVYESTGAASAFLAWSLGPATSLELAGGSYLREPYQGFPRGRFLTVGLRLGSLRSTRPAVVSTGRSAPPLVPERRGDSLVVRFRFANVRSVAIAGDWNGWKPLPLRAGGGSTWEGTLALHPGTYHFNVLVDGREWVVPAGVQTIPDGAGGLVAVLKVR